MNQAQQFLQQALADKELKEQLLTECKKGNQQEVEALAQQHGFNCTFQEIEIEMQALPEKDLHLTGGQNIPGDSGPGPNLGPGGEEQHHDKGFKL